jgi:hypothetical protein
MYATLAERLIIFTLLIFNCNLEDNSIILEGRWEKEEIAYICTAIMMTGTKLGGTDPFDAFVQTFDISPAKPFIITHFNRGKVGGIAYSSHRIGFSGFYRLDNAQQKSINLVLHEIGHAFEFLIFERLGYTYTPGHLLAMTHNFPDRTKGGYYGSQWIWQQSYSTHPREEFADMFIGWTRERWGDNDMGKTRKTFMDQRMAQWLILLDRPYLCKFKHCWE